jgi:hypothetical protein
MFCGEYEFGDSGIGYAFAFEGVNINIACRSLKMAIMPQKGIKIATKYKKLRSFG